MLGISNRTLKFGYSEVSVVDARDPDNPKKLIDLIDPEMYLEIDLTNDFKGAHVVLKRKDDE